MHITIMEEILPKQHTMCRERHSWKDNQMGWKHHGMESLEDHASFVHSFDPYAGGLKR